MNTKLIIAAAVAFLISGSLALASDAGATREPMLLAQASCADAAAQVDRRPGVQVIGAPQTQQSGGRTVCIIPVLITDPSGQNPPRSDTIRVTLN